MRVDVLNIVWFTRQPVCVVVSGEPGSGRHRFTSPFSFCHGSLPGWAWTSLTYLTRAVTEEKRHNVHFPVVHTSNSSARCRIGITVQQDYRTDTHTHTCHTFVHVLGEFGLLAALKPKASHPPSQIVLSSNPTSSNFSDPLLRLARDKGSASCGNQYLGGLQAPRVSCISKSAIRRTLQGIDENGKPPT